MSSTGPEIFIIAFFFAHLPITSPVLHNAEVPQCPSPGAQLLCPHLMPSVPSPQETPRYFRKKPHVPHLSSLLSLLLGSSIPFSHPFTPLLPIPLCGCPEPQLLHQDSKRDRKKMNERRSPKGNPAGGFSRLHKHLPPTPSSHGTVSPCPPSVSLHPITNAAVDHLFLVLEAPPARDPPSWLQFFTLFLAAGRFPISLCDSKRCPRLRSVSFIFRSVF